MNKFDKVENHSNIVFDNFANILVREDNLDSALKFVESHPEMTQDAEAHELLLKGVEMFFDKHLKTGDDGSFDKLHVLVDSLIDKKILSIELFKSDARLIQSLKSAFDQYIKEGDKRSASRIRNLSFLTDKEEFKIAA